MKSVDVVLPLLTERTAHVIRYLSLTPELVSYGSGADCECQKSHTSSQMRFWILILKHFYSVQSLSIPGLRPSPVIEEKVSLFYFFKSCELKATFHLILILIISILYINEKKFLLEYKSWIFYSSVFDNWLKKPTHYSQNMFAEN